MDALIQPSRVKYSGETIPYGILVPYYGHSTFRAVSRWIPRFLGKNVTWCWSPQNRLVNSNNQECAFFYFLKMEDAMACALRWNNSSEQDQNDYTSDDEALL